MGLIRKSCTKSSTSAGAKMPKMSSSSPRVPASSAGPRRHPPWSTPGLPVQGGADERALAKIPPEVRRRQVAHDMAQAKQYAANAKASSERVRMSPLSLPGCWKAHDNMACFTFTIVRLQYNAH
eukprot:1157455-Pelagomonas_calceolata.AAC.11